MSTQSEIYFKAILTKDYRFDGKFFVAAKTTMIYCRPICPAKPKRENVVFFPDALAAERSGYRPCLRCRPEAAPMSPAWLGKSAIVQRALRIIATSPNHGLSEDDFAARFGVGARHLRRLFQEEVGKSPGQLSADYRLNTARQLITETRLPITEVAFASGYKSVRRFNAAILSRFHRSPTQMRSTKLSNGIQSGITVKLPFRPPLDWSTFLAFYQSHGNPECESVSGDTIERVFAIDGSVGAFRVRPELGKNLVTLQIVMEQYKQVHSVIQNVRRMLDLDSDPIHIEKAFSRNRTLRTMQRRHPGLRLARGWCPFETLVTTVLGQLVSVEQARRLTVQLVSKYGREATHPFTGAAIKLFPAPDVLANASLDGVGATKSRKNAIRQLASWVMTGQLSLDLNQDFEKLRHDLLSIDGIGPWTAEYACMRAFGDTDAFPASDLIIKRALELHPAIDLDAVKPWRSYAAIHLWQRFAKELSKKKQPRRSFT